MNNTLNYYLTNGKLPGKVCCIYSFGRSGSYLFQSLFENFNHPEVLTVGFSSLIYFKESVKKVYLKDLNTKRNLNSALQILDYFPHLFSKPILGPSHKTVNKKKFVKIFVDIISNFNAKITYESLLKIIFISFRLAQKNNKTRFDNLVYLWQVHYTKNKKDKLWIEKNFKDLLILTIVRFPEKSIDSHLIHHLFENIVKPHSNLFNSLFYEKMLGDGLKVCMSKIEYAIRFEDIHNHPRKVLKIVCKKLGISFFDEMISSNFIYNSSGSKVSGLRKIKHKDLMPKILTFYDCIKIRYIMENYYTKWDYEIVKNEFFNNESRTEIINANTLKFTLINMLKYLDTKDKIIVTRNEIKYEQQMNEKAGMNTNYKFIKQRIYNAKKKIRDDSIDLNLKKSQKLFQHHKKNRAKQKEIIPLLYDTSNFFIINKNI